MLGESVGIGCEFFGIELRNLAYVERDAYAAAIIVARMVESSLDKALVWDDLATFNGKPFSGAVDILCAGLPCQPYSCAGKQRGHADERSYGDGDGPIPHFLRIVAECRPAVVFVENVTPWVRGGWFRPVGEELCRLGYTLEDPLFLTAEAVGASHKRELVFVLAHRQVARSWQLPKPEGRHDAADVDRIGGFMANASRQRRQQDARSPSSDEETHGRAGRNGSEQDGDHEPECPDATLAQPQERGQRELRQSPGSDGQRQRKPGRGADRRAAAGGSGESMALADGVGLADSIGKGLQGSKPRTADPQRPAAERSGEGLGNAQCDSGDTRRGEPEEQGARLATQGIDGRSQTMADTKRHGQRVGGRADAEQPDQCDQWPLFAPGPNAAWSCIPEALWPATQSGFRVLADGQSLVLDESRADQLRCSGNSVVALCGAVAFVELMRRALDR